MSRRSGRTPHREFLEVLTELTRGPGARPRGSGVGAPRRPAAPPTPGTSAVTPAPAACRIGTAGQRIGGRGWDRPPTPGGTIPVDRLRGGIAEIKPHVARAMAQGLGQLRASRPDGQRFLITYRPIEVGPDGRAAAVCVYAVGFSGVADIPRDVPALRARTWAHLGPVRLPGVIPFPLVVDGGFFGSAVEHHVRERFGTALAGPAGRTVQAGTGGHRPGPDVRYEQAEFYASLARELGDPMLAELARELLRDPARTPSGGGEERRT
jgi:hypothetical protein